MIKKGALLNSLFVAFVFVRLLLLFFCDLFVVFLFFIFHSISISLPTLFHCIPGSNITGVTSFGFLSTSLE